MKLPAAAAVVLALAFPVWAQAPQPDAPAAKAETEANPRSMKDRFFVGGGIGAAFGSVDYLEIAPLVGLEVVPRVSVGLQPFYRWSNDGRFSPSVERTDYGARAFARFRVVASFFVEADYQFTSHEYLTGNSGSTRASDNAFLAGVGYTRPLGRNVGLYFSVLYDFTHDDNDFYSAYDSPVQLHFGVAVGF